MSVFDWQSEPPAPFVDELRTQASRRKGSTKGLQTRRDAAPGTDPSTIVGLSAKSEALRAQYQANRDRVLRDRHGGQYSRAKPGGA